MTKGHLSLTKMPTSVMSCCAEWRIFSVKWWLIRDCVQGWLWCFKHTCTQTHTHELNRLVTIRIMSFDSRRDVDVMLCVRRRRLCSMGYVRFWFGAVGAYVFTLHKKKYFFFLSFFKSMVLYSSASRISCKYSTVLMLQVINKFYEYFNFSIFSVSLIIESFVWIIILLKKTKLLNYLIYVV